jgi:hypothetical protein
MRPVSIHVDGVTEQFGGHQNGTTLFRTRAADFAVLDQNLLDEVMWMRRSFPELPGWSFLIEEVSAGMYEATAEDAAGHRVQTRGTDPEALLASCHFNAGTLAERGMKQVTRAQ